MAERDIFLLLRQMIEERGSKTADELDQVFKDWWDSLTPDERFEAVKVLAKETALKDIIAKCGCSERTQRCGVAM